LYCIYKKSWIFDSDFKNIIHENYKKIYGCKFYVGVCVGVPNWPGLVISRATQREDSEEREVQAQTNDMTGAAKDLPKQQQLTIATSKDLNIVPKNHALCLIST
jgi:hypothetical protein